MTKEANIDTSVGKIPDSEYFQRVNNQSFKDGKTGEALETAKNLPADVTNAVKGLLGEQGEKTFALVALIGFTLVFYSGHLQNWNDFFRYTAFLGIVSLFYLILTGIRYLFAKK